jgi:ADP-ribose pyrophosphatase YjhB (NUDIX family)
MTRMEYYHDVAAPQARGLLPVAYAIVRNDLNQILLVRRADDLYWELPGGRVDIGESASTAVVREVAEEAGVTIEVTGLAGVYSDPGHILAYPGGERVYQQFAVCSTPSPQFITPSPIKTRRSPQRGSTPSKQHS